MGQFLRLLMIFAIALSVYPFATGALAEECQSLLDAFNRAIDSGDEILRKNLSTKSRPAQTVADIRCRCNDGSRRSASMSCS